MEKEEFTQEMYDKSIEIALKLTKVLVDDEGYSTAFMMFCVARFTAGLLSTLQKNCKDVDLATEYTDFVKKMMKDMDGDEKTQAVRNQTKENKEDASKLYFSEKDILRMLLRQADGKGN